MKIFKIFSFIFFFVLLFVLVHSFYMQQSVFGWLYDSIYKNDVTRIDIYNSDENTISVEENIEDMNISYPEPDSSENRVIIELPLSENWQTYNISFISQGNGQNRICFRAPEEWKQDKKYPIMVDYKKIAIDGEILNSSEKTLWFSHFLETLVYEVKDGQTINISVTVRKHHFKWSDFKLLFDTYSGWEIYAYWRVIFAILVIAASLILVYLKKFRHLFCFLTIIFLILPTLCLSKDNISKQENRGLSKFQPLISDNKINEKFGIDFNNWFSDRFGGRRNLIDLRFLILYFINGQMANEDAFAADDNWLFPTKGIKKIPSQEEQHDENIKVVEMLKKIVNYFEGKDIHFYLVLEPSRSVLYKKYWDNYYPYIPYMDYISELKDELKEYKNFHFIDLNDVFEQNKDKIKLYEKNDPHMTLDGVNLMIESIMSEFGTDLYDNFKKHIVLNDKNCTLFSFLHYYDDLLNIEPTERDQMCKEISLSDNSMKITEKEVGLQEATVASSYFNKDLYILFPCYEEYLFPILGNYFAHTVSVNYNAFDQPNPDELRNKALSKLKSIKAGTTVMLFLSYPTEYNMSSSLDYWEAF